MERIRLFLLRILIGTTQFVVGVTPMRICQLFFRSLAKRLRCDEIGVSGSLGRLYGSPFDLYVMGKYIRDGAYHNDALDPIRHELRNAKGGTFIDIGANIGLTTIPMAQLPGVSCISFEPEPVNFRFLEKNLNSNGLGESITTVNCAVFENSGEMSFETSEWNFGDHRISNTKASNNDAEYGENRRQKLAVRADTFDLLVSIPECKKPVFVKVDVQGAECGVFAGGERSLPEVDGILFEFWPYGIRRLDGDPLKIFRLLRHFEHGSIYEVDGNVWTGSIEETINRLQRLFQSGALDHVDVLVRK